MRNSKPVQKSMGGIRSQINCAEIVYQLPGPLHHPSRDLVNQFVGCECRGEKDEDIGDVAFHFVQTVAFQLRPIVWVCEVQAGHTSFFCCWSSWSIPSRCLMAALMYAALLIRLRQAVSSRSSPMAGSSLNVIAWVCFVFMVVVAPVSI
jgi:hypothetical protein